MPNHWEKKRKYGTSQPLNKNKGSMEMRKERLMVCVRGKQRGRVRYVAGLSGRSIVCQI